MWFYIISSNKLITVWNPIFVYLGLFQIYTLVSLFLAKYFLSMKNTEKCMEFSIQIVSYRGLIINSHCIDGPNRPLLSVNRKKNNMEQK